MKRGTVIVVSAMFLLAVAAPAIALEDGILEVGSVTPSEDLTSAVFHRTITNASDAVVDLAPRDLRMAEYPTITVSEITVGSFAEGIWTIGQLDPGQTASIAYVGAAPDRAAASNLEATEREELPFTGPRTRLAMLAILGLGLIALGLSLLRTARA